MKRLFIACICTVFAASLSGCAPGDVIDRFVSKEDSEAQVPSPDSQRVYMDEIHGVLKDFTGNQLTLANGEDIYVFDVSQAELECEGGMITGDEISVIYEGRLEGTDTGTVRPLKSGG